MIANAFLKSILFSMCIRYIIQVFVCITILSICELFLKGFRAFLFGFASQSCFCSFDMKQGFIKVAKISLGYSLSLDFFITTAEDLTFAVMMSKKYFVKQKQFKKRDRFRSYHLEKIQKIFWMIKMQYISLLKLFLLYQP